MSPVVPLVLMVAAGIHENADRANLEQRPTFSRGVDPSTRDPSTGVSRENDKNVVKR